MLQQQKQLQLQIIAGREQHAPGTGLSSAVLPAKTLLTGLKYFIWSSIFFALTVPFTVTGDCVMYGVCGQLNGTDLNCNVTNNGSPKPIQEESYLSRLYLFCPDLFPSSDYPDNETLLCCNEIQIDHLITQLYMAESLISKCPSCFYNLKQSICDMICSTNQDKWLRISETIVIPSAQEKVAGLCDTVDLEVCNADKDATKGTAIMTELITAVDMFIDEYYIQEVFESCKDVQPICTGRSIMKDFCGPPEKRRSIESDDAFQQSSFDCNAKTWFEWIGDPRNGFTPFRINYLYSTENNEGMELYDKDTVQCCDSITGYWNGSCSSDDCTDTCFPSTDAPTTTDDPDSSDGSSIISITPEISCIFTLVIHIIAIFVVS